MNKTLRVLNVDDCQQDVALLTRFLTRSGSEIVSDRVDNAKAMTLALESREWDVVLCDYTMPNFNALAALALMKKMKRDIPFIIISGSVGEAMAVEAMRAGAHDYLMKDNLARLGPTIDRELQEAGNRRARRQAEEQLRGSQLYTRLLMESNIDALMTTDPLGSDRHALQTAFHASRTGRGRHPFGLARGASGKLRTDRTFKGRPRNRSQL